MVWFLLVSVPAVVLSAIQAARWSAARTRADLEERVRLLLDVAASDRVGGPETDRLMARLTSALGIEAGALLVRDGDHLRVAGSHGYWPHLLDARFRPGEGLVGRAWVQGRPHLESDVTRRSEYVPGGPGLRSGLYVPGSSDGEVVTVLCLESRRPGFFGPAELAAMQPVADLLAVTVHGRLRLAEVGAHERALLRSVGTQMSEPLTLVAAALATDDGPSSPALAEAATQARRLSRLVDGLHLVHATGHDDLSVRAVELAPLVHPLLAPAGASGRLEPVRALADPGLLTTALTELLDNAARHAPGAAVTVEITTLDGRAQVTVRDEGPGLPTDVLLELLRSSPTTAVPGTRLGLHLTRSLVERMGGRLEVWSGAGVGATLTVSLPPAG